MVALLGIHTIGYNVQNNSGFAGPWGLSRQNLTNHLYKFILGINMGNMFTFAQTTSDLHVTQVLNLDYQSPEPVHNKLQWTVNGGGGPQGKVMLNVDMGMIHVLEADSVGAVSKKYCPQLKNSSLYNCS